MKTDPKYECSIIDRLNDIRMTPAEHAAAKTYLQQGVRAADVILQVLAWSRAVAEHVGRGVRGLARHTH
jgi:hypothetical protein